MHSLIRSFAPIALAGTAAALAGTTAVAGTIFVNAATALPTALQTGNSWAFAYKSLQSALASAASGDQIWVAAGTYKPTTTSDRTISFAMLDGVQVLGGFQAGDAFESDRDPAANVTVLSGDIGTPVLNSDNSFHVVTADNVNASGLLDGFTIRAGNSDNGFPGGGMRMTNTTTMTVRNCRFTLNNTNSTGGGVDSTGGSPKFIDCVFDKNTAVEGGGMNLIPTSNVLVVNCLFAGNDATTNGGGLKAQNASTLSIVNTVFSANTAGTKGGGVAMIGGFNGTIAHCTFRGNDAPTGGALRTESATLALSNSILFDDTATTGPENSHAGGTVTIKGCCIEGIALDVANGNFSADPQFVDPNGANNILGDFDDNLRLGKNSPCIDHGNSTVIPADLADLDGDLNTIAPLTQDADGHDRVINDVKVNQGLGFQPFVDVGAYEVDRGLSIFCVDQNATGANNGADWGDAFVNLQDALAAAGDVKLLGPKEVWVADGTYKPTATTDRTKSYVLPAGVGIYGGFAGGEGSKTDRDSFAHPAILSGEIGAPGLADNSFHVIEISGSGHTDNTILDGFVITAGNANGGTFPIAGGGLRVVSSGRGTIRGCRFIGNSAVNGGAVIVLGGNTPKFVNCHFSGNSSTQAGGAIQCNSAAVLFGCTIVGNTSATNCGGVLALNVPTVIDNSIVYFNNDGLNTGDKEQINTLSGGSFNLSDCCIVCAGQTFGGLHLFGNDPLLADPDGPDNIFGTLDDSPALLAGSPCIDQANGINSGSDVGDTDEDGLAGESTVFDIANNQRSHDDSGMPNNTATPGLFPDIGAWEFQGTTVGPLPSIADLDHDGDVDGADLGLLLAAFGTPGPIGDLNFSCFVDGADLGILLSEWD
ncbi:MAG: right-handed parallel beta-helix repeat-containing protein [Phycisphaerales bacterium]